MYCPQCGKEVRDDAAFCQYCGTELKAEKAEAKPEERLEEQREERREKRKTSRTISTGKGCLIIIGAAILIIILVSVFSRQPTKTGTTTAQRPRATKPVEAPKPEQGPPEGHDGAAVMVEGAQVYVYRMSVHNPQAYRECQRFTGPNYAFMILGIDNTKGKDKFTWHCWTNSVRVKLADGTESKTIDLSDWEGFYMWKLHDKFSCTETVYPGKREFLFLAFTPAFSWKDVREVTFQTGAIGAGIRKASWIRIK